MQVQVGILVECDHVKVVSSSQIYRADMMFLVFDPASNSINNFNEGFLLKAHILGSRLAGGQHEVCISRISKDLGRSHPGQ